MTLLGKMRVLIRNKKLWESMYAVLMGAILVTCVLPLFKLTRYAIPYYDDYAFVKPVWVEYMLGGYTFKAAIMGSLKHTILEYFTWQGTFSSTFLAGLMPLLFGEQYYYLGPRFVIMLLGFAILLFCFIVARVFFHASMRNGVGIAFGAGILVFLFVYSAQQAFFWYTGGLVYVGTFAFALLFLTLLIWLVCRKHSKIGEIVLILASAIYGFFMAAGNYVTALQMAILLVTLLALGIVLRDRRMLLLIPATVSYSVGFVLSVMAPGNAKRAVSFAGMGLDPVSAILTSFSQAIIFSKKFLDWRTLLVLLMLLPIMWSLAGEGAKKDTENKYKLSHFCILLIWSICYYASCFTPELYAAGGNMVARSINIMKMTFQLLLLLNLEYVLVLIRKIIKAEFSISPIVIMICAIPWVMAWNYFFRISPDPIGQYSAFGAKFYLESGQAQQFHAEYERRIAQLKSPGADVVFEPYSIKPWFLIWKDLSDNPNDEPNRFMSNYYGKESVVVKAVE